MITVKTGAYSTEEIALLSNLIAKMEHDVQLEICAVKDVDCSTCKYYHICTDLTATHQFLIAKVRQRIYEV